MVVMMEEKVVMVVMGVARRSKHHPLLPFARSSHPGQR